MRKILSFLTALVLVATPFVGCGNSDKSNTSNASVSESTVSENSTGSQQPKEKIKLTISYKSGDATVKPMFAGFFEKFNEMYKDVYEIEPLETGSQTHEELLKVKLATGDFPDVWQAVELSNYVRAGVAGELPEEICELVKFLPLYEGKAYYAPMQTNALGVYYNADIFAQNGIEIPKTYSDFLSACEKIKATGVTPLAFGGKDAWHTFFIFASLLQNNVINKNPEFNADLNSGKAKWTDAEVVATLQKYQDLFNSGYVDKKGALSTADAQLPTLMGAGKTAMLIEGPWMVKPIVEANPDIQLRYFPLPADNAEDTTIPLMGLESGWGLSKKCVDDPDRRAAGIAFLEFFFSKDIYTTFVEVSNAYSTLKEEITYEAHPASTEMEQAIANNNALTFYAGGIGEAELPAGWWEYSWKVCQDLVVGVVSAEEAGKDLQDYYEKMLSSKQ